MTMRLGDIGICRKVYDSGNDIMFLVAGQDHYGPGITTLLTERIIGVRALDAAEQGPESRHSYAQAAKFGSNNYGQSNLHQWLNAEGPDWYRPAHPLDNPPANEHLRYAQWGYLDTPGFLTGFSRPFRQGLRRTDIPVLVRTGKEKAELGAVGAAVFLASRTEMCKGDEWGIAEGKPLPIFYDHYIFKAKPSDGQMEKYGRSWNPETPEKGLYFGMPHLYDPKFGWWYYMRTPNIVYDFMTRVMSPYGSVSYTYANNDVTGIRPLVNLDSSLLVEDDGSPRAQYRIVG